MTTDEMIDRLKRTALASIHGGWGAGEHEWLLEVADKIRQMQVEIDRLHSLLTDSRPD